MTVNDAYIYKRLYRTKSRCSSYVSTHANTAIVPFTKNYKESDSPSWVKHVLRVLELSSRYNNNCNS